MEDPVNRRWHVAAALLVLAAMLGVTVGCSSTGADPLSGTQWRLTGWSVNSIDPSSVTITVKFADGQISGNSGVNSYGGPYTVGPGGSITLGALAMTEMAGPEPAMRAESAYQTLLAQVGSYTVAGGKLTLYDKGGNESLIFEPTAK
jgi:heat shock protein HslJ